MGLYISPVAQLCRCPNLGIKTCGVQHRLHQWNWPHSSCVKNCKPLWTFVVELQIVLGVSGQDFASNSLCTDSCRWNDWTRVESIDLNAITAPKGCPNHLYQYPIPCPHQLEIVMYVRTSKNRVVATWLHKALRWFKREDFLMSWLSISLTAHTVLRQFYCGTFFGLYSPLWRKHESRLFFGHLLAAFPSMMLRIPKSSCHFLDQAGTAPPGAKSFKFYGDAFTHWGPSICQSKPETSNIIKYHQISSNIIKYHQISSNEDKPPWHHPASCGTSCQRYADSSWEGSLKPSDVDRSVGYVTICRVCSWAKQCRATDKDNPKFNTILPSPRKSASICFDLQRCGTT